MTEAYIYDAVRTPRGKGKKDGSLHEITGLSLATQVLEALRDRLQSEGIPHVFVELTAPDDALKNRLQARTDQPHGVSDARAEDFEMLTARYEAPDALEDDRHVQVEADADPDTTTTAILKHLVRFK